MAIAGHVSRQMLEHYSHVRLEVKRRALEALSTGSVSTGTGNKSAGYDTNHDTDRPLTFRGDTERGQEYYLALFGRNWHSPQA